jgi:diguanylate cyclase (GGDEF)-like protein
MGLTQPAVGRATPNHRGIERAWLSRFGDEPPIFAGHLVTRVLDAIEGRPDPEGIREAAESLGVLRAQHGHAVAGLVEDLTALRALLPRANDPAAVEVVDGVLTAAAAAYVDELTAILESRATRDPLTGLPNRAAFTEALRHEISAASRESPPALLLIDLDGFKGVNDTDGHLAGDAVLIAVASLLTSHLRGVDLACRLGGDEFAVLMPRTGHDRAVHAAERLLESSREAEGLSSEHARVTLSIGVGWLVRPRDNEELIAATDAALYRAKARGGDSLERCRENELEPA